MTTEFNVIAIALENIKNDNIDSLDKALRIMPLEELVDTHEVLLSNFLALCAAYNRSEAAFLVLERWKVVYPENEKISMFTRLFLKIIINVPTLSYLASIHKDVTYVELIDELAQWDSSEEVVIACGRVDEIYGNQPYDTYLILRKNAIEYENARVEEYLFDKITEVAPFAPKPEYVKNYLEAYFPEYKNRLPTQQELDLLAERTEKENIKDILLPNDDEAVRLMTEGLTSLGIAILEIESAKQFLKAEISKSLERKKELLLPILQNSSQLNLETDRILYWIYGASNPLLAQNLTLNTPTAKYGGGRMFLTNIFDYNEEDDYFEEWFVGYCEQCLLRIEKKCHAVRMPGVSGGWKGCFCSWKCVRDRLGDIENDQGAADFLSHALIDAFEKRTNEIGITDRIE